MTLVLHHAVRSDVGHVREGNEDAGYAGFRLVAVADGMGGQAAGEVASRVAIGRLAMLDEDVSGSDPMGALQSAVLTANQDLREMVSAEPELEGMGTTVTALLAAEHTLALAHIGDSRCYQLRAGVLTQITRDHTYVQSLVDDGQLSSEEAAVHPQRSLLTRALDGRIGVEVDLSLRQAQAGDRYLLCTDGLSGVVTTETIAEALALTTPEEAVEQLVDLALRGGGPDNITVVVVDVLDTSDPHVEESEEPVIAGAAAEGPEPIRAPGTSAAARAAAAAGQPHRARAFDPRSLAGLAGSGGRGAGPSRRLGRRVLSAVWLPLLALIVIAGGLGGAWVYVQDQYYVGVHGTRVAIFEGVSGHVGPLHLSSLRSTAMPIALLPPYYQQQVRQGITAKSLADARTIVAHLAADEQGSSPTGAASAPASSPSGSPSAVPSAAGLAGLRAGFSSTRQVSDRGAPGSLA